MLPKIDPTNTRAWKLLQEHKESIKDLHLRDLFHADTARFEKFSITHNDILFDYSKNLITEQTLELLNQLAITCGLPDAIRAMFNGEPINETEKRAVLHTALRNSSGDAVFTGGEDVMPGIRQSLQKIKVFCKAVHKGDHRGYTGKRIRWIVNIGIGGSDLGPQMITEALKPYKIKRLDTFFVSNIDASHLSETLKKLDPERTLFLIASKTFTTQETMTNARTARTWFLKSAKYEKHVANHFVAISTNEKEAIKFGIDSKNIFGFWDWVGGRYSLWSSIGLSIALSIGYKNFELLLKGASATDEHFKSTSLDKNIPVIMGLIGIWYVNFYGAQSEAILPYDQYLHRFAAYMQQGNMESNGKSINRSGEAIEYATGPVVWGEPGTNGQHAFYQLLHQGQPMIPCDFIAPVHSHNPVGEHHQILLSNFFAQSEALMNGKTEAEVEKELEEQGLPAAEIAGLLPFKVFPGNRPSNSFLIKKITPFTLGSLVAIYEHKIFVQGVIWNIYSFDQWGVELGKQLANKILPELAKEEPLSGHDPSTRGLINAYKKMRKLF